MIQTAILPGMLLFSLAAVGPALAADYPYSGFFTNSALDEPAADAQLTCANGFFRQDKDGSFVNYHLDAERYRSDGTVRYVQYGRGFCTLLDGGKIEACRMTFSSEPTEIGAVYIDVIRSIMPEAIEVAFFDKTEDARAWIAGGAPEPGDDFRFVRCAGFDDERLGDALTTEESRLSTEDRDNLLNPTMDAESSAAMAAILDKLLKKP